MNVATIGSEQKPTTQGPALNKKPRYCWLNTDKMDGSDEIGMVARIKSGGEK